MCVMIRIRAALLIILYQYFYSCVLELHTLYNLIFLNVVVHLVVHTATLLSAS
jgi:hypothetical protein